MRLKIKFVILAICCLSFVNIVSLAAEQPETKLDKLNAEAEELYNSGRYHAAILVAKEALKLAEKQHDPNGLEVAKSLNNLAILYVKTEQWTEAEKLFKKALAIKEKKFNSDSFEIVSALNNLSLLYFDQGRYDLAEPLLKRTIAIQEKTLGPNHGDIIGNLHDLSNIYLDTERYGEAEVTIKRLLSLVEKQFGNDSPQVADTLNDLAVLYAQQEQYEKAEQLFKQIISIREKGWGVNYYDNLALALNNLAMVYCDQNQYNQAKPLLARAISIQEKVDPNAPNMARISNTLGILYSGYGDHFQALHLTYSVIRALNISNFPEAMAGLHDLVYGGYYNQSERFFKKALLIHLNVPKINGRAIGETLHNLSVLYTKMGCTQEAKKIEDYLSGVAPSVTLPNNSFLQPIKRYNQIWNHFLINNL